MFHALDWVILIAFLLLTTLAGHLLRGKQSNTAMGFFRGGKDMPWWAVATSLIATKTSALTFISVPAAVFAVGGDLKYLQITIGFVLGNFLMAWVFIGRYYQEDVYSPYEYFERRLGSPVGSLSRTLFLVGALLSQSVRLLSTAVILSVITGLSIPTCIWIIGAFSVLWAWIGGVTTVIWTDFILFIVFIGGALLSLLWIIEAIPGGIPEILRIADDHAKLALLDLSLNPRLTYTLWVGLLGATLFELGMNAVDQVVTQRSLCCRDAKEARKAICWSAAGVVTTHIMLLVGLGLVAFFATHPPSEETAELLRAQPDRVFPTFVVEQLPVGVSGLIIAALFAAGISTLDSALTAVSQTSVQGVIQRFFYPSMTDKELVRISRWSLILWGGVICFLAIAFNSQLGDGLLQLGLSVPGYVYGALLGIAWLALRHQVRPASVLVGSIVSVLGVITLQMGSVSFFWWYLAGAIFQVITTLLVDRLTPGKSQTI